MTDTPLLRLARALLDGAECRATFDETTDRVRSLVRDLEAAPFPDTGLEPRGCPTPGACSCPVARRTITRAQHIHAMQAAQRARQFTLVGGDADDDAYRTYAVTLGLTVEDA